MNQNVALLSEAFTAIEHGFKVSLAAILSTEEAAEVQQRVVHTYYTDLEKKDVNHFEANISNGVVIFQKIDPNHWRITVMHGSFD